MITIVGVCADMLGHSLSHSYALDERGAAHHHRDAGAVPASAYRVTKDRVPVDWRHRRHLGEVVHLERDANLTVVAELDDTRLDGVDLFAEALYWSPETWETRSRHGVDAELLAIALTPTPAGIALPSVRILAGTVETAARRANDRRLAGILTRAVQARSRRHYGDRLVIEERNARSSVQPIPERRHGVDASGRPIGLGPVEWSPIRGRIIAVR